jgi:hypothetical protein
MNANKQSGAPISREQWAEIVAEHSASAAAECGRRLHPRHPSLGSAQLAYTVDDGYNEVPTIRRCTVLEISADGVTFRSRERIPLDEPVVIELTLGGGLVALWGHVVHCTQTVGAFKVGVKLEFPQQRANGRNSAD